LQYLSGDARLHSAAPLRTRALSIGIHYQHLLALLYEPMGVMYGCRAFGTSVFLIYESNNCYPNYLLHYGRVEGGYYAPPLPFKSGRATFAAPSFRQSLLARVDVIMAAFMHNHQVFVLPIAMISVYVM
jgi:hypothetical protein